MKIQCCSFCHFFTIVLQGEKEMFVALELIRPLESSGGAALSEFSENDKVEVLFKGIAVSIHRYSGISFVANR